MYIFVITLLKRQKAKINIIISRRPKLHPIKGQETGKETSTINNYFYKIYFKKNLVFVGVSNIE